MAKSSYIRSRVYKHKVELVGILEKIRKSTKETNLLKEEDQPAKVFYDKE